MTIRKHIEAILCLFAITFSQMTVILLQSDSCVHKKAEVQLPILPLNFQKRKKIIFSGSCR